MSQNKQKELPFTHFISPWIHRKLFINYIYFQVLLIFENYVASLDYLIDKNFWNKKERLTSCLILRNSYLSSFIIEQRQNSIRKTNNENRDQNGNQNVCGDICTRTFRTTVDCFITRTFAREKIYTKEEIQMKLYWQTTATRITYAKMKSMKLTIQLILVRTIKTKTKKTSIGMV